VVLFTVDTLRADRLGPWGNDAFPTPAVDRLAREGLVFEACYSQSTNTNPSFSSILTGLVPPRHGVLHQTAKMSPDVITLPMMLQAHGIRTGSFVANLCKLQDVENSVFNEGWDEKFCGMEKRVEQYLWDEAVVDAGTRWIEATQAEGEPFFAWIHLMDPHSEHRPPPDLWDYEAQPLKQKLPQIRYLTSFEELRQRPPEPVLRKLLDLYAAEVRGADRQLGRVLDFLDGLEGSDSIALIFSADHGEELYETWHRIGHGLSVTEGVLHVPLVIRAPGLEPGRVAEPVESLSLTPTVLHLLDLRPPYPLDGPSWLDAGTRLPFARSFESNICISLRDAEHRYWYRVTRRPWTRKEAPWRAEAKWFREREVLAAYPDEAPTQPSWLDLRGGRNSELKLRFREDVKHILQTLTAVPSPEEIEDEAFLEELRDLGYLDSDVGE